MSKIEKYGFVYMWRDRKHKRYYIGCHWGTIDDGYVCSSNWMRDSYKRRPEDFKRRILKSNLTRENMYIEEAHCFSMMKPEELKTRYYNLCLDYKKLWHMLDGETKRTISQKISEARKGKCLGYRDPSIGIAISAAKKGKVFTEDHKAALAAAKLGTKKSEEWKQKASKRIQEQWDNGKRKRKIPQVKKTEAEISQLHSSSLKSKWADPEWKARQIEKLKIASNNRKDRKSKNNKYNQNNTLLN